MDTLKLAVAALGALLFVVFTLLNIEPATNAIHEIRTDLTTDNLACTTGVGDDTCTVTLTRLAFDNTTTNLTATQLSPGAGSHGTLIANNQTTVTIEGLSASTDYTFNVGYVIPNPSMVGLAGFDQALEMIPVLMVIIIVVAVAFFGGIWAMT